MSSPAASTTKMTNAPTDQTKMVKIKAVYPLRVIRDKNEQVISPGQESEVTEEEAKEFCDREFDLGHKNTFGNIEPRTPKMKVRRAVRL